MNSHASFLAASRFLFCPACQVTRHAHWAVTHSTYSESTAWPSARDVYHKGPGSLTLRTAIFALLASRVRGTRRPWSCWLLPRNDWARRAGLSAALLVLLLFLAVHHCHRRFFLLLAFAFAVLVVLLFLLFPRDSRPLGRRLNCCPWISVRRLSAVFASLGKLASSPYGCPSATNCHRRQFIFQNSCCERELTFGRTLRQQYLQFSHSSSRLPPL